MNTTIRFANAQDQAAVERLAQLDSSVVPAAPLLLAEEGGRLIAAISARNGTAVADPFTRSADAVELLRRRARQLGAGEGRPRRALRRLTLQPR
ncbi:hypothetical protein C8N24_6547 [Solirubrobacter pauli]|uniref:Uncharacterized protein n=1 Tax=Solirubrobacter pauli TaxID=166793 RepID=A0A660KY30_9ACTN|nr:hypothetical protein [Solirubrobacter pauli]RKQ84916.1 hypothetical protein C8N24_6547 [Solirubrobacter pauli]